MKKILLLAACSLSLALSSHAQHFKNGIGTGVFVEEAPYYDTKVDFSITYSPAFFFAEQEKTSFSIGVPITVGVHAGDYSSYYSDYDGEDLGVMIDIPAIFNFNYGAGAVKGNGMKWGFFAGGGYGYHLSTVQYYYANYYDALDAESFTDNTMGITVNTGFRIGMGRNRRHNLEVKFSYMKGLTNYKPQAYGINCLFNF